MAETTFRLYGGAGGPSHGEADTLDGAVAIAKRLNHYERVVRSIHEREKAYPHKLVATYTPTGKKRP